MSMFGLFKKQKQVAPSSPFSEMKTNEERIAWLLNAAPWNQVDGKIIRTFVEKFGDNPMLEVFVYASERFNLVSNYSRFPPALIMGGSETICVTLAGGLFKMGANCYLELYKNQQTQTKVTPETQALYMGVFDCLESAIVLSPDFVDAFYILALTSVSIGRKEECVQFATEALKQLEILEEKKIPFHLSSLPMIQQAGKDTAETKTELQNLLKSLK